MGEIRIAGDLPMGAAAIFSASVVSIGSYLAIASMVNLSMSWIGLGILAIAVVAAVAVIASEGPSRAPSPASTGHAAPT
jgi:multisubunit Na+/H+ antiporter MnhC subunit